ncbi:ABC transporter permease [Actinoplanes sp. KI2]|uniref:ABC transporter permease n=1 Tax=Actinoplanes sp. KI2 TaxID=2983315 RepID=UPI0021D5BF6B|nr:ABC transporter permease [Actinoplanes sp. KI2]MCU7730338.1 ABC transporter permease [Actinoplanes sp. KI2]
MSVLRAEWIKLRSLRSVLWTTAAVLTLMVGLGALFSFGKAHELAVSGTPADRAAFDPTAAGLSGMLLAQIAVGVLGVLVVTSEFASGSIRPSLAAVPVRGRLLAAKAATAAAVALVIGWAGGVAAFLLAQRVIAGQGLAAASLGSGPVLRALLGAGLYLAVTALFGLAVGAMLRSTAGALTIVIVVLLLAPIFSAALPEALARWVAKWWPSMAGLRVVTVVPDPSVLAPWAGFGVLAAFGTVMLAAAFLVFARRDV